MAKTIDGEAFKNMIIQAAAAIEEKKEEINALNVFPVPDGDTGTNMSLTLSNAATELQKLSSPTLGKALDVTSSALLRGARGNSGVITSLIFRGIAREMHDCRVADGTVLAHALAQGAETAYKAVMKPAEGTMLTVMRVCGEAAIKGAKKNPDPEAVLLMAMEGAKKALIATTEQNPVLKKANVVDAGGYGVVLILQAMHGALSGKLTQLAARFIPSPAKPITHLEMADFSKFDAEEINFAYCTEFIAIRADKERSPDKLRQSLESIGDCVVVVDDEDIIKIHVHTDEPDKAMSEGLKYGPLTSIKIENMLEQHEAKAAQNRASNLGKRMVASPENEYGFVAVAAGQGVCAVFGDLGADHVVEGGQTMNPSTEDILQSIDATPARVVFVLPNNKNIIMASQQAAALSDKEVVVIPSKSIPQGVGAMLAFDPEDSRDGNEKSMSAALEHVGTGSITYAARDSEFDGKKIKEGDFLALEEGKLLTTSHKFDEVIRRMAKSLCKDRHSFITIFYGEGADLDQAKFVQSVFEKEAPAAEINVIYGAQPVYSYIVSVE